ncbi:MAG: ribosome-recycling factor [Patescibacteria group bacterium]|nr:ribosome-recycling factor [Patescibacteria group bacterium]MCL5261907.1 ribosome-recycling factor [Patescibacteria group bacterium]
MDPIKDFETASKNILAFLKGEMQKIRSNRPSPGLVEDVKVDAYGQVMTVNQLATINVVPPRELIISPWDKSILPAIEKAVSQNNSGLSISADGNIIRVSLPSLTTERRDELAKMVKALVEENRIKMRLERDKVQKIINTLPEDQKFKQKDELQKKVDRFNEEADQLTAEKLRELNE